MLICSHACFQSEQVQLWLLQALHMPQLCLIPVIADEGFLIPSGMKDLKMEAKDLELYNLALKAVFQEIAVVFVPQNYSSTQQDLELRANQAAMRLAADMKPLSEKVAYLASRRSAMEADATAPADQMVATNEVDEQPDLISDWY